MRRPVRRDARTAPGGSCSTARRPGRPPAVPELELPPRRRHGGRLGGRCRPSSTTRRLPPPFWAFAWLGGQAVARYVLDTPAEVAGRRVLDLATGSGLCALAAARAGAAHVEGVDVDPVAVVAARAERRAQRPRRSDRGAGRPRRAAAARRRRRAGRRRLLRRGDGRARAAVAARGAPRRGPRAARRPGPALPAEGAAHRAGGLRPRRPRARSRGCSSGRRGSTRSAT